MTNISTNARVKFTRTSSNAKTGPIPTTYTTAETCPTACPLKGAGCYAELGPVALQWNKAQQGLTWAELCREIEALPADQLWRHNVAGDLPHNAETIDAQALQHLIVANHGRRGFTYTHHDMQRAENRAAVQHANAAGFTVNLSANSLDHADELAALDIGPVVSIVDMDHPQHSTTPAGRPVIVCPAVTVQGMTCATCKLCSKVTRHSIVAFPVHGTRKKAAARVIMLAKTTA
jgi:hypothetical protein